MNLIQIIEIIIDEIESENYNDAILMLNTVLKWVNEMDTQIILMPKEEKTRGVL